MPSFPNDRSPSPGASSPPAHPSSASRRDPERVAAEAGPRSREDWEQVRRSVAMLPPGAWAMTREEALRALRSLVRAMDAGSQS